MSVALLLTFLGGIIILGVIGNFLFSHTRVPMPVILMLLGVLLGPATGWITSDSFSTVAPYFGTIALILILFEGGLDLEFETAVKQFVVAFVIGFFYFSVCVAGTFAILFYLGIMPAKASLLSAFVLGGTSPAVIFPVVAKISASKELKTLLRLETAMTEVMTVVAVVLFLDVLDAPQTGDVSKVVAYLMAKVGVALILAGVVGFLWSRVMSALAGENLSYMLTLGVVFLLYAGAEELGAEPALTILFFGLILGNAHWIAVRLEPIFHRKFEKTINATQFVVHETLKHINAELSFLVRTFFFVFMGLLVSFANLSAGIWISAILILALLSGARWLAVRFVLSERPYGTYGMISRGLACAVMALIAIERNVAGAERLLPLVFLVILGSNIIMTGWIFAHESQNRPAKPLEVAERFSTENRI